MTSIPALRRVVLPLDGDSDEDRLLLPATVLAHWFETSIQLVTPDGASIERYNQLAAGLGVPVEPVAKLDAQNFPADLAAHLEAEPPAVCVVNADADGVGLARAVSQATFLMAAGTGHRLATGPLVVPITGSSADIDAQALAATWAMTLDLQVRLVVDRDDREPDKRSDEARTAERRLEAMGVECAIDRIRAIGVDPAIALARSRSATALVIPVDRHDLLDLVPAARDRGVALLIAPTGHDRHLTIVPPAVDASKPDPAVDVGETGTLSEHECLERLAGHRVGRLGYVDDGRPVVVPVNVTMVEGDLFIRSLPGTKVSVARRRGIVCLQVDRIDETSMAG